MRRMRSSGNDAPAEICQNAKKRRGIFKSKLKNKERLNSNMIIRRHHIKVIARYHWKFVIEKIQKKLAKFSLFDIMIRYPCTG